MTADLFGLLCGAAVLAFFLWKPLREMWSQRRRDSRSSQEWRKAWEAENPDSPPYSQAEIDEVIAFAESLALPATALVPDETVPPGAHGCHLAGPAFLAAEEPWPLSEDGLPMVFWAQIDFSALPALPGFPGTGVLLLFTRADDLYGADLDDPTRSDVRALWRDAPRSDVVPRHAPSRHETTPFSSRAEQRGVSLRPGELRSSLPSDDDWRIHARRNGHYRRPGAEQIDAWFDAADRMPQQHHQIGGHPAFVQGEFRTPGHCDQLDRVLLRLTADAYVCCGDAGEAHFMMTAADLSERRFDRIAFYWDCG